MTTEPVGEGFYVGQRVYLTDPSLEMLRRVMWQATGKEPPPNHHGTVHEIWDDGSIEIWFDNEKGEGQGQSVPYPPDEVRPLQ
jgi:hypothetical protein